MRLTSIAALITVVATFRVRSKKGRHTQEVQQPGQVDGLYTYGSPATAQSGLKNMRGDNPCFPGLRTVMVNSWFQQMDDVPHGLRKFGYEHPWSDVMIWDLKTMGHSNISCSEEALNEPNKLIKTFSLHNLYILDSNWGMSPFLQAMKVIGVWIQYDQNPWTARAAAARIGWRIVHSAYALGELFVGGLQVSHFLQNPETLECAVTFQGTKSFGDVVADLQIIPQPFCGLPTTVHMGFRDHLRRMLKSEGWQQNVRPYLSSCSKVYATGTSLGGALSELFSACANFAPSAENDPDGDYALMGWSVGTPSKLKYE